MKRTFFSYPYIVWMMIFIFSPMLLVVYYAFTTDGNFTAAGLVNAFDPLYLQVLLRSIYLALIATICCIALGYPIAYLLSRMKRSTASLLSVFFIVPMWMNFLLRTYAWQVLLDQNGVFNLILGWLHLPPGQFLYTQGAVLLGMVYNFLPFMVLPIYTVLIKIDQSHIEAANDLGANRINTFLRVVLPQSMPGVISGIMMVFIPAITTFAISRLLGGSQFMMYGDLIENQFLLVNDWNSGSALSLILLILVLISMFIMRRADHEAGQEGGTLW